MSSLKNKNLLVAGFTVALLIASHRATADCHEARTGIMCTSDEMCVAVCLQRGVGAGGYCSTEHVVGDPSCVCGKPCAAQSTAAVKHPAAGDGDDAGGRMLGMAN